MKFYAKIGDYFFHLFTISQDYSRIDCNNHFVKIRLSIQPESHGKIQTKSYTIHPSKIHIKSDYKKNTSLIGDHKGNPNYETILHNGYDTLTKYLINVFSCSYNDGFVGRELQSEKSFPKYYQIIEFPDNLHQPYWIGIFFTSLGEQEAISIFENEGMDRFIYTPQKKSNVLVLIKYLIPEWERLGIKNPDYKKAWINPTFLLSKQYQIIEI